MKNIVDNLLDSFTKYSKFNAIDINGKKFSYNQLKNSSLNLCSLIRNKNFSNSPIGILCEKKIETYVSLLATIFSGNHYVPINLEENDIKINHIIKSCNINLILGTKKNLELVKDKISEESKKNINFLNVIINDSKNEIEKIDLPKFNGEDLIYILFTSGSTGVPKGVMVTHNNVSAYLRSINEIIKLKKEFKCSHFFDLTFDVSVKDLFLSWSNGCEIYLLQKEDIMVPIDFIIRNKLDVWASVPSVAIILDKMNFLKNNIMPSLKISMFTGEPLPKTIADKWLLSSPNSSVWNLYGPTEATVEVSGFKYNKKNNVEYKNGNLPIGTPFNGTDFMIIDENLTPLQKGMIGEIIYTGLQITKGYLGDTQKTKKSFRIFDWDDKSRIWYLSGDLGFINDKNQIECMGRKDNQVKILGKRVEIEEIEFFFKKYTKFKDIVIIPIKVSFQHTSFLAAFTTMGFDEEYIHEIRALSKNHINDIFFPKKIFTINNFDYMVSGKVDKKNLIELYNSLVKK